MTKNAPTLVGLLVPMMLAIALIATRLTMRLSRRQRFNRGDYWCLVAAVLIAIRLYPTYLTIVIGSTACGAALLGHFRQHTYRV
jgi:hypothetical protein